MRTNESAIQDPTVELCGDPPVNKAWLMNPVDSAALARARPAAGLVLSSSISKLGRNVCLRRCGPFWITGVFLFLPKRDRKRRAVRVMGGDSWDAKELSPSGTLEPACPTQRFAAEIK